LLASPFRTDDWPSDIPARQARTVRCPRAAKPPTIDGKLDDEAWRKCEPTGGFTVPLTYRPAEQPTEVRMCWDDRALYVAFRCTEPEPGGVVGTADKRDDNRIWKDDHVEVVLDTAHDRKCYRRIAVNVNGQVWDAECMNDSVEDTSVLSQDMLDWHRYVNAAWNGAVTAAAGRDDKAWTLEMEIRWDSLGAQAPRPGQKMGLQLRRTRGKSGEPGEWSCTGRDRQTGAMLPPHYLNGMTQHYSPMRFGVLTLEIEERPIGTR
jgi:hypothetical protein